MKCLAPALLLVLATGLTAPPAARAEIYRWTDASGTEHFTTDLDRVPPAEREAAKARAGSGGGHVNVVPSRERVDVPETQEPPLPSPVPTDATASESIGGHDRAWWAAEAKRHQNEIEELEQAVELCETPPDPLKVDARARRSLHKQHKGSGIGAVDLCTQRKQKLDTTRRRLDDLRTHARKQGVPPGWLRKP